MVDKKEESDSNEEAKETTQIGIHAIKNLLGSHKQLSLFSDKIPEEFSATYGFKIKNSISQFGAELTDIQLRVMEGILYGFSKSDYKGNVKGVSKESAGRGKFSGNKLPSTYDNVDYLPKLRITQVELLKWANINLSSQGEVRYALDALKHLATTQYCFYYNRLAYDKSGNPIKDEDGKFEMESVVAVDSLFTIKEVRHKASGKLEYYEVLPSALFLDQRQGYFLLIPFNWREEVRKLVGQKRASVYTFRFLLFLRYQFEMKRQSKSEKKPYVIKWSPEEIAIALKMPESVYLRKRTRANNILENAYSVAKELGYLSDYTRDAGMDILILNDAKYFAPSKKEKIVAVEQDGNPELTEKAKMIYDFLVEEKKKILPNYKPQGGGQIFRASLNHMKVLLSNNSVDQVKEVVKWGFSRGYWVNRIGTPSKLRKHFNEALAQMTVSGESSSTDQRVKENIEYAKGLRKQLRQNGMGPEKLKMEFSNTYVEIATAAGMHQPSFIKFSDNSFKEQLDNMIRKVSVTIK